MVGSAAVAAASAVVAVPAARAADPQVVHFHYSSSNDPHRPDGICLDHDFCGTGKTIDISYQGVVTPVFAPNQPIEFRNESENDAVLANPANGAMVLIRSAYQFSTTLISGDPNGEHTYDRVFKGE